MLKGILGFVMASITAGIVIYNANNPSSLSQLSTLNQIKVKGKLNVLIREDPTTYYKGVDGFTGLEYDLVMLFAEQLDVEVNFILPKKFNIILDNISQNKADIAAAGLTITSERQQKMRFTTAYQRITEQVVYRSGNNKAPKTVDDLEKGILEVTKGSSHYESLIKLKKKYPQLTWNTNTELNSQSLLYLVNEGLIDYTISDSQQINTIKHFYPKLKSAFDITEPRLLAWALPFSADNSLYDEVQQFFARIKKDKTLAQLLDKHYGNTGYLSYVGNCTFRRHVKSRLPRYKATFIKEAEKHHIDWRLLAAIGYQESHWRADAVSPTGVKGLMMLTKGTAKDLGIKNRKNPTQSIIGGALYFKQRLKIIPERIKAPDRVWFALASYNVGFGHLEDARKLTVSRKGDADKWLDVKKSLPLLAKKRWYSKTKYGYARGKEPVHYVENIRSYYRLLKWLTEENQIEKGAMPLVDYQHEEFSLMEYFQ